MSFIRTRCDHCGGDLPAKTHTGGRPQRWCSKNCSVAAYRTTPKGKYVAQKTTAKQRGIEFLLTFEEWWEIWEPHWEGRRSGGLVMCRTGDEGPYAVGNVRIDTAANNVREGYEFRTRQSARLSG